MAYDEGEVDEGKSSKFNAGILMTQRVNNALTLINNCKTNMKAWNEVYQDFNYNICWNGGVKVIYNEVDGHISKTEREECDTFVSHIDLAMRKYPIHETMRTGISESKTGLNEKRMDILIKYIEVCERMIRKLGLKYAIFAATAEDDEGL